MKLAPSKNPEADSKKFATIALISGIASLLIWVAGIVAVAFGIRGLILSRRVGSTKYLIFSIVAIILGLFALVYYYTTR